MGNTFTKLFHSILGSSVWEEDDRTRLVWITLLAKADQNGEVRCTVGKLQRDAIVPIEAVELALEKFKAPDSKSLTKDHEGRRIEEIEGGWRLLNHGKYQEMMSPESRREYWAEQKRKSREKMKGIQKGMTAAEIVKQNCKAREELENGGG